ncbi:CobW family GTP-binding protein [Bradyrhizobium sp. DOA9]|uniref:CobW family GTP-binding protein n=1 Tax=Bradyrhizobium sp. DOA9 TaxID=1126627 RepID=UPI000468066A|nr:GTP-binding protein [Bradyrhizobium sp. DOA9]
MLPTTIICGFLGSGKTTLINYLLRHPGSERLAVLVNDFGAINIDQDLIKVETENRIELNNGCVCCSIRDDLASGLVSVSRLPDKFTRVLLECSGVSHPAGVLRVFESDPIRSSFCVDGVFCLIDTSNVLDLDYQSTELAIDQAAMSDLVLLTKTDLVPQTVQCEVREMLQAAQRSMKLLDVVDAQLAPEILFGPRDHAPRSRTGAEQGGGAGPSHSELYESASFHWTSPLAADAFARLTQALPPRVLRGKGVLSLEVDGEQRPLRAVFQLVGKRSSLDVEETEGPETSQIVLIARRGELDRSAINAAIQACPGARSAPPLAPRRALLRPSVCD